jgi:microcystin-dependent protein
MSTPLIDNFELKVNKPIDNRFVVGPNNFYTTRDSITNKYEGLRVWDSNVSSSFFWNGSEWVEENQSTGVVNGTVGRIGLFTSTNTIGDSIITQDVNRIGIGRPPLAGFGLAVNGGVTISGDDLYIARNLRHVGDPQSYLAFSANNTIDLITSNINRMRVTPSGNIGFGITNPSAKVHVAGNVKISNSNSGSPISNIIDLTYPYNPTATKRESYVILGRDSDVEYKYRVGSVSENSNGNFGRFVIDELVNGNWQRSLTKTSAADGDRYGIGTVSPEEKVHVVGTTKSTNFKADKGYYSFQAPSTSNTDNEKWLKVFSISYSSFSSFNFTLKINGGGNSNNTSINTDVYISFKRQNSESRVYANISNYGETQIKPTEDFKIIKEGTGTNQGRIYIYHKVVPTFTACTYTILGKIDATVEEYLTFEETSPNIPDTAWTERIISSPINHKPSDAKMSLVPLRTIVMFSGSDAQVPIGWRICEGGSIVNGISIPDLRGRFIVGKDTRTGSGYTFTGAVGGEKEVTLDKNQMPIHKHNGTTQNAGGHFHNVTVLDPITGSPVAGYAGSNDYQLRNKTVNTSPIASHSHDLNVQNEGGGQAHENRPPYYTLAYIIYVGE